MPADDSQERRKIMVAAAIIHRRGAFLAAKRPERASFAGYWEFPGGKAEKGESPADALRRELAEEVGINIIKLSPWRVIEHEYAGRGVLVELHFFEVREFEGEPVPREGQILRWITEKDARKLAFLPADEKILASLFSTFHD